MNEFEFQEKKIKEMFNEMSSIFSDIQTLEELRDGDSKKLELLFDIYSKDKLFTDLGLRVFKLCVAYLENRKMPDYLIRFKKDLEPFIKDEKKALGGYYHDDSGEYLSTYLSELWDYFSVFPSFAEYNYVSEDSLISQKNSEIEKLKKEKYDIHEKEEVRNYKKPAKFYWLPLAFILLLLIFLSFTFQNNEWNFVSSFIKSVDKEPSSTLQWIYRIVISTFITVGLFGLIKASYNRLAKNGVETQKDIIKSRYTE